MNIYLKWRTMAGLKQREVADALGVRQQTIQKWEYGQTKPPSNHWEKLSELFKIPLEFLLEADMGRDPSPSISMMMTGSSGSNQAGRDLTAAVSPDSPNRPTMLYLTPEETHMIEMIRDYGGRKMVERFTAELEKRRQEDYSD